MNCLNDGDNLKRRFTGKKAIEQNIGKQLKLDKNELRNLIVKFESYSTSIQKGIRKEDGIECVNLDSFREM